MSARLAIFLMLLSPLGYAQKVGLVMSGGGAKGLAHIGVLKALEENEIPIDYAVGTSMGGIVAGAYAAGLSPSQLEMLALTKEFQQWVSGKMEKEYSYYFYKDEPNGSFIKLNLSLDSAFNVWVNSALVNDQPLNFALCELFSQASAAAKDNFDSLLVPLRVVAADLFTQTQVVLREGALSAALRATMSVPIVFPPVRVNGKYLFDGGVYNNFPADVLAENFRPDVTVGSNVSSKSIQNYPYGKDEELLSKTLQFLLINQSDRQKIPSSGVYIEPDLTPYSSLNFTDVAALIDSGYVQTMRQMPELKKKIQRRAPCDDLSARRKEFYRKSYPIVIDHMEYEGFTEKQTRYINNFFYARRHNRPLYLRDAKRGYSRLVSETFFNNLYPTFIYRPERSAFAFKLAQRKKGNLAANFGGVIASRNESSISLGVNYYLFGGALTHFLADFTAGTFYKSAHLKARTDISSVGKICIEPFATLNSWDYLNAKDFVVVKSQATALNRIDRRYGLTLGFPMLEQYRLDGTFSWISNRDLYVNTDDFSYAYTFDALSLNGIRLGFSAGNNNLNRKQYASEGSATLLSADYFRLTENYLPGNTSKLSAADPRSRKWVRAKLSHEKYFKKSWYSVGYLMEGVVSNQPLFINYFGTLVNQPAFYPYQDSRTFILKNYRAYNYAAGGIRNVFRMQKNIDFRLEGYLFKPLAGIEEGEEQTAVSKRELLKTYLTFSAALVWHITIGPLCLTVNYYDDPRHQLGVLLHAGFLLFRKNSLE